VLPRHRSGSRCEEDAGLTCHGIALARQAQAFARLVFQFPDSAQGGIVLRVSDRGTQQEDNMQDAEIGWIAAIIIGGLAGWLAEMFMKSGTGILTNIVLGIVGAALANFLLGFFGVALGGWLGYLVAGFVGACILIFAWRAIKGRT
jgi:uncharacterized membrane protein YeaQ/YmgE (transglycosylase-associated protein family)